MSDDLIPVFVYGTLRIGHGNYLWAAEAVEDEDRDCTTNGRIYFVSGTWGYPVAKFDEEGTIQGDILWFDPDHPTFHSVYRMEIGAGYSFRAIKAVAADGSPIACFGFHYENHPRGKHIESGDWASEELAHGR